MEKNHYQKASQFRLVNALLGQPVDRIPVWLMRQAGRYLPEYRALRAKAGSFLTLCQTPELACEVTLQPLNRFDLDAAIIFSDILTVPDAMGLGLYFSENEGPKFHKPITTKASVVQLPKIDVARELPYVFDAIRLTRKEMPASIPLIGFSGSPWTLATYMVEGETSKTFNRIKAFRYQEPDALNELLTKLSDAIADYLNAQIVAGVQTVMIFDTWGGILTPSDYFSLSVLPMQRAIAKLTRTNGAGKIPVICFTKGGGAWLELLLQTGCDAIGLDWMTNLRIARQQIAGRVAVQGNLDPGVLYASAPVIEEAVKTMVQEAGTAPGFVANLGHGVPLDISPQAVQVFVDAVHRCSDLPGVLR